ncbi:hypothetical protein EDEG_03455 [Edhazardia aedis USNM 41457]|uniref:Uncharacterized protein n=1 Tax=Edhazardia aedis (strain USNM 41457) TaxID=1003232 RepID=J9DHL6_EDHAE|nr:hypothetical protein EDEG_03455 [Edhazardia aedis USNM 41457]|eukprot:EJW02095.1 hypothetical protein EDEG_03455 [Edhazardia aedis USNM 41457]
MQSDPENNKIYFKIIEYNHKKEEKSQCQHKIKLFFKFHYDLDVNVLLNDINVRNKIKLHLFQPKIFIFNRNSFYFSNSRATNSHDILVDELNINQFLDAKSLRQVDILPFQTLMCVNKYGKSIWIESNKNSNNYKRKE